MTDLDPDLVASLGITVMLGAHLLAALRRVEDGESADLVFAEIWANAEHINRDEEDDE